MSWASYPGRIFDEALEVVLTNIDKRYDIYPFFQFIILCPQFNIIRNVNGLSMETVFSAIFKM